MHSRDIREISDNTHEDTRKNDSWNNELFVEKAFHVFKFWLKTNIKKNLNNQKAGLLSNSKSDFGVIIQSGAFSPLR
jgi:hypothetical protein